ncbi:DUF7144 family membrane protein [Actinocatenispora rupis]|uniref:DUF7144 domain-containing protein n=1 Tax=Actinocatenispora rupis TaxID=519421 RepID=A0A8J3NEK3_9ACTN|nr:hypothetical protein [Actinocatenispora rupis]GID16161.1 hypothetical protein Aru02nite_70500 [Actinocatenispora rupis]
MSQRNAARSWAAGGTVFAATMLLIVGVFQVLQGIEGIARGSFYVVAPNYLYHFNTTAWGWIHLAIGAVAVLTGVFLFVNQSVWARGAGIVLASLSAIANFFFIPYYPFWSLVMIALDAFVIWSLATVGSGARREERMGTTTAVGDAERWPMAGQQGTSTSARMDAPAPRPAETETRPADAPGGRPQSPMS